ncbi:MAG: hypothetical protein IPI41_17065, partial [Flavobacteriales bacterium]|nr:hypothetical protein [Flavobacteriales bacterium]
PAEGEGRRASRILRWGGGTILPQEIKELHELRDPAQYHPDDGRAMGLQGMINDMLEKADFDLSAQVNGEAKKLTPNNWPAIAKLISTAENHPDVFAKIADEIHKKAEASKAPVLCITGTGGAGKSSMVDELIAVSSSTSPRRPSASSPWTRASARPVARCWVTASV